MKPGITRSMRTWRKFHRFTFGYSKWVSLISVSLLMIISITGILLIHQDDLSVVQTERVSLKLLPEHYSSRLEQTRAKQGTTNFFTAERSVPLRWVILDLHTGAFFGKYGPYLYDLLAIMIGTMPGTFAPEPSRP